MKCGWLLGVRKGKGKKEERKRKRESPNGQQINSKVFKLISHHRTTSKLPVRYHSPSIRVAKMEKTVPSVAHIWYDQSSPASFVGI